MDTIIFKHLTHGLALRKLINMSCYYYLNQQVCILLSREQHAIYAVRFQPQAALPQER